MNSVPEREIRELWNMVFNLALNFLHNGDAAEEVAQEIFLKAHMAFPSFRGDSSLGTWLYRIAYNHLVDGKRHGFRDEISFELFENDVNNFSPFTNELGLTDKEMEIYVEQVKIGCTKAMLQCLDPDDRFVFIISKIFGFSGRDGAEICGLTEPAYRQKLSRASRRITNFMTKNCGLLNKEAVCTCRKRIGVALEHGRINPDMLLHHTDSVPVKEYRAAMNDLDAVAAVYRDNPFIDTSDSCTREILDAARKLSDRIVEDSLS